MENDSPCNNTRSKTQILRDSSLENNGTKPKRSKKKKEKKEKKGQNEVDDKGNLKGFIVPDNYVEYEDGTVSRRLRGEKTTTIVSCNEKRQEKREKREKRNRTSEKEDHHRTRKSTERTEQTETGKGEKISKITIGEKALGKMAGEILLTALLGGELGRRKKSQKSKKSGTDSETETDPEQDSDYNSDDELEEDEDEELEYTLEEERYLKGLSKEEKTKIDSLEEQLQNFRKSDVPYRFKILDSSLDMNVKSLIIERLDQFYMMDSSDAEYHKLNRWLEGIMKVPFGKYSSPMISIDNSPEEVAAFLSKTKKCLDEAVFGHEIVKTTILQSVAMMITNPTTQGKILALQGPPGNGKTTLIREGVAKAMGRPFAFIALGGATDSCILEGHDFTYEGSQCGRILNILKKCGTMDPVICFDELDKLSETPKGEEIANLLCHLTDHSQNTQFHDKYYSGIDFDLSKATFIFSFNDITKVNPILLDRIKIIPTKGFKKDDKLKIAKDYLLPKICQNIGFPRQDIIFKDDNIKHIITNYTEEEGVRNLKRGIETIIEKLNLLKITQQEQEEEQGQEEKEKKEKVMKPGNKLPNTDNKEVSTSPPPVKIEKHVTFMTSETPAITMSIAKEDKEDKEEKDKNGKEKEKEKENKKKTLTKETDKTNRLELVSYHIKNLSFPFTLTNKIIDLLLKEDKKESNTSLDMLYL